MNDSDAEELKSLSKKRAALEQLIAFTQQICKMANSLDLVQEMVKPSQIPNKRFFPILSQLTERLKSAETPNLLRGLNKVDGELESEIHHILTLSQMSEKDFYQRFSGLSETNMKATYELLAQQLIEFKRKAQTDVAIRYCLNRRGVMLEASKLLIPQEALGKKVDDLKRQETACKLKIENNIQALIQDTDKILNNQNYPEAIKQQVAFVRKNLEQNLAYLREGKDIEEIPVFIESVEIRHNAKTTNSLENNEDDVETQQQAPQQSKPQKNQNASASSVPEQSFFKRLKVWLTTPWNISWKSISQQNSKPGGK